MFGFGLLRKCSVLFMVYDGLFMVLWELAVCAVDFEIDFLLWLLCIFFNSVASSFCYRRCIYCVFWLTGSVNFGVVFVFGA